jgi:hypothetical protein
MIEDLEHLRWIAVVNDRKLEEIFAAKELVDAYMQDFDRKLMKLRLIKNG